MKGTIADHAPALQNGPRTLAIDVGDAGFTARLLVRRVNLRPTGFVSSSVSAEILNRRERRSRGARVIEFGRSRQAAALHGDYDVRHVSARTS